MMSENSKFNEKFPSGEIRTRENNEWSICLMCNTKDIKEALLLLCATQRTCIRALQGLEYGDKNAAPNAHLAALTLEWCTNVLDKYAQGLEYLSISSQLEDSEYNENDWVSFE